MNFLFVFFGGGIGCLMRYMIGLGFQRSSATLPWATFFSNISACFIFAGVLWIMQHKDVNNANLRLLLLVGLCGGLSTFSTFGYETYLLLKQSLYLVALLNILVTTSLSIFIFYLFN
ncbi:FluC/FEX family fluoride channel [Aurantibacillus circumpalustris]|uniref:FluC/FEX family fluoride channel n=1 Tax=Aurantibacillus circumpalustris TaxID=3036359 RepID=UPI00295ABC8B|nr:CrcB family protein [Aurantibacillus circumpalustris]